MQRIIGIGKQDFEKIVVNNNFYIDKTHFIKEWWESEDDVTVITRLRRFGKTLTMSMVEQFFSLHYKDRRDLFEEFRIWETEKFRALQGTYPVISLSFANVKERNFLTAQRKICQIITNLYNRHGYLDEFGMSEKKEIVKEWYDGFCFGKYKNIYNPWSILNFLKNRRLGLYWANTSSNDLTGKLIREGTVIDEQIVFSQLETRESAVWSLLLASGYLKVQEYFFDEHTGREHYKLALTNKEVKVMFENMIREWFSDYDSYYNDFMKALLLGDVQAMNEYMNEVALSTFSFFDTGKMPGQSEPERFYHGFVLGLMVDLEGRYRILSNRESGFGRYDVLMEPVKSSDDGIILEFKVFQPAKESGLWETVENALKQIEVKQYEQILIKNGVDKSRIRKYGFAFEGKRVLIGE